jgi:PII-like signaling protein
MPRFWIFFFHGVSGATVTRGIAGFGADHHLHTTSLVDLAVHLPVKIEFIETAEKVDELLPKLQAMVGTGLIEMHDTTIVKPAENKQKQAEPERPALKREGKAKMMRIYIGENDKWNGQATARSHRQRLAIERYCRRHRLSGNSWLWRQSENSQRRCAESFSRSTHPAVSGGHRGQTEGVHAHSRSNGAAGLSRAVRRGHHQVRA